MPAKKKPGKPSDFQGERAKLLQEFYPTYADASKRGKTRLIWVSFFKKYWEMFPWRLPLTQDPDPNNPTDYALKPQNPEEEDYQHYMQHEDYKAGVAAAYNKRTAGLLAAEPQDVQTKMKEEVQAEHAALLDKHEDALEGMPALDEEDLDEARQRFSELVGPLLDGLAAHMGYEISLLVGRVRYNPETSKPDIEALSLHAGVTSASPAKLDFSRADARTYADVMKTFSRFVWNAHEYRNAGSKGDETTMTTAPPIRPVAPATEKDGTGIAPAAPTTGGATASSSGAAPSPPLVAAASVLFTDTFTDEQVRDFIRGNDLGDLSIDLSVDLPPVPDDDFSFPSDLMPMHVDAATVLPGLGAPIFDPYDTAFAAPPSGDLLLMLEKMTPDERATKVEALKGMSADEIDKENNAARNYFMLNSLGLSDAEKETLEARVGEARVEEVRTEVEVEESEGEEDESDNEPETPTPRENATQQKQKQTGTTATKGKGTARAIKWERRALSELESKDYGVKWKALVSLWWKREETAGFKHLSI
ncbi:hypothetical protein B0H14DRAFT_3494349 [Mycena olivaceomarginata]|nr:hypothetical protein B0H14DRAFT_3494349 [Mycena olivaceomarginata]